MPISREAVVWGFRMILGREPESEEGILAHMRLASETELAAVLLRSAEFAGSGRFGDIVRVVGETPGGRRTAPAHVQRSRLRAVMYGNCQVKGLARLLQAMTGDMVVEAFETTPTMLQRLQSGESDVVTLLERADLVFVQLVGEVTDVVHQRYRAHAHKLRYFPPVAYAGFHPDAVYIDDGGRQLMGPMGGYHSSLVYWAWRHGLHEEQALELFDPEVFRLLSFDRYHDAAWHALSEVGQAARMPLAPMMDRWNREGCWMHTINHPKLGVLADVAAALLRREGIEPIPGAAGWVEDPLLRLSVWPVYPGLGRSPAERESYVFKIDHGHCPPQMPVLTIDLRTMVSQSYRVYERADRARLTCTRVDSEPYQALASRVRPRAGALQQVGRWLGGLFAPSAPTAPAASPGSPYQSLPDQRFWRRAVERVASDELDPVVSTRFTLESSDRIATAGSCFAQHIAATLQREGLNYFVADRPDELSAEEARRRNWGVYSARYGNLYTARQLLQLFDRAFGSFHALPQAWQRADGRWVDPFRPEIEPDGFDSEAAVKAAAATHLADVQRMFRELDVFVFTLGLTEAWCRRADGAVLPLAPGVVAGRFEPDRYEFVNFGVEEVASDLLGFFRRLRAVNANARMLLTVSPVPLIATYEDRHVLVSTVASKSVLRAAAQQVCDADAGVDYFPSYEIVTGAYNRGAYFESDLRSVAPQGVQHVMRVFLSHYTGRVAAKPAARALPPAPGAIGDEQARLLDLVCEEEALDREPPARSGHA